MEMRKGERTIRQTLGPGMHFRMPVVRASVEGGRTVHTPRTAALEAEGVRCSVRMERCVWNEVRLRTRLSVGLSEVGLSEVGLSEVAGDSRGAGFGASRVSWVMTKLVGR